MSLGINNDGKVNTTHTKSSGTKKIWGEQNSSTEVLVLMSHGRASNRDGNNNVHLGQIIDSYYMI